MMKIGILSKKLTVVIDKEINKGITAFMPFLLNKAGETKGKKDEKRNRSIYSKY